MSEGECKMHNFSYNEQTGKIECIFCQEKFTK